MRARSDAAGPPCREPSLKADRERAPQHEREPSARGERAHALAARSRRRRAASRTPARSASRRASSLAPSRARARARAKKRSHGPSCASACGALAHASRSVGADRARRLEPGVVAGTAAVARARPPPGLPPPRARGRRRERMTAQSASVALRARGQPLSKVASAIVTFCARFAR